MKHLTLLAASTILLSGCILSSKDYGKPAYPEKWTVDGGDVIEQSEIKNLERWWENFNDPVLTDLVDLTLMGSPDVLIAEARINEARGLRRTTRSFLFPQISGTADAGRSDTSLGNTDDFYEAGFDASFEIDVFGRNRNAFRAADRNLEALEASYHDVRLTLVADVARTYIDYRAAQKQVEIALRNLDLQQKTLDLVKQQKELGEAPQLDVERSETLVNTTKASIPAFKRAEDNARLRLTVLTGILPEGLAPLLEDPAPILSTKVAPVLQSPADILSVRPDIRAAESTFRAATSLSKAAVAELFPRFTLSGFYGVAEGALFDSTTIWDVTIGSAVALIDFGRIEGAIDAARAVEMSAYQGYRKTVLEAVVEVETALADYAYINKQRTSLQKAFDNADRALNLSQDLFREGEISFIDLLDAQRTRNEADSALVTAEASQAESLIRLYKALGVY